ncbi:MAG: hypothetical protein PHC89_00600 [Candidatus Pacebacteria bacterium]|nr:hypothetical protein [Candidatus Paceibacterota bacterium]
MSTIKIQGFFPENTLGGIQQGSKVFFDVQSIIITLKNIFIPKFLLVSENKGDFLEEAYLGTAELGEEGTYFFDFGDYFEEYEVILFDEMYDSLEDHPGFIKLSTHNFLIIDTEALFEAKDIPYYSKKKLQTKLQKVLEDEDYEVASLIREELEKRESGI